MTDAKLEDAERVAEVLSRIDDRNCLAYHQLSAVIDAAALLRRIPELQTAFDQAVFENTELNRQLAESLSANGLGGWIYDLRKQLAQLREGYLLGLLVEAVSVYDEYCNEWPDAVAWREKVGELLDQSKPKP